MTILYGIFSQDNELLAWIPDRRRRVHADNVTEVFDCMRYIKSEYGWLGDNLTLTVREEIPNPHQA